jgi:cell division protein FtsB
MKNVKNHWPVAAVGGAILYFAANAVAGDQGLASWAELQRRERALHEQLDAATQEKVSLDERAAKLKGSDLDMDLVDERARELLGYARADEVILFAPAEGSTAQ